MQMICFMDDFFPVGCFLTELLNLCRYSCDCSGTGYYGETCEIEINECDSSPCHHNATCIDRLLVS